MRSDELERQLTDVHAPRILVPGPDADLEAALLARFDARPRVASGGLFSFVGQHRLAAAMVAMLVAGVGACAAPASFDVPLGLSIEMEGFDPEEAPPEELATFVHEFAGASQISIEAHQSSEGMGLTLRVWGAAVGGEELVPALRESFPALEEVEIVHAPLEGRVETTLGGKLWRDLFDDAVRDDDIERAKAHLLDELRARGVEGAIDVSVEDRPDGAREVRIGVEQDEGELGHGGFKLRTKARLVHSPDGGEREQDVEVLRTRPEE